MDFSKFPMFVGFFLNYFFERDSHILKTLPYRELISLLQRWVMCGLLVIQFLSMCKVVMLQSLAGLYKPMAAIEGMHIVVEML